jgi:hypothetical protein
MLAPLGTDTCSFFPLPVGRAPKPATNESNDPSCIEGSFGCPPYLDFEARQPPVQVAKAVKLSALPLSYRPCAH